MMKVNEEQQELYEDSVINEYYEMLANYDKVTAYALAMERARGIYSGGAYLGFKYDFDSVHLRLNRLHYNRNVSRETLRKEYYYEA